MAKKQKSKKKPIREKLKSSQTEATEERDADDFDFGGLPKDVPFKRNIGCGG